MRKLLNQLRIRLILGALLFLLGLTGAVILVVRDSLLFSARNMTDAGTQALLAQRGTSLLEIVRREAELSDHATHHDPSDLEPLRQRLHDLQLTPNAFAFVIDADGQLMAASSNRAAELFGEEVNLDDSTGLGMALSELDSAGLREILLQMRAGESGISRLEAGTETMLLAYAPLEDMRWSLAIVEPVADLAASADPLSEQVQSEVNGILQTTLITIGYFAVVAVIGAVLAARALTGPIQTLVDGTRSITAGDLHVRIPVKSSDELGVLADSFNQMADSLQTRTEELMEANQAAIENARLYEQARTLAAVEERQRLARELHDSVTQSLYSLTLLAEASRRTAQLGDVQKVVGNIARLGETAQQALKEMRLLVYELRPLALEQAGLADALQHRLDAVEKRAGVNAQLRVELDVALPADVENALYRIAQETLNNALKHAEATAISISLRSQEHKVHMEIMDNGKGFSAEEMQDQGGLGLVSIRERAESLRGNLSITSKPGEGTRVSVSLPLQGRV